VRGLAAVAVLVALFPAAALAQGIQHAPPSWPGLQGGPGHRGVAADPVPPPLKIKWRLRPDTRGDTGLSGAVVARNGTGVANGRTSVVAFDPETGTIRWTHPRVRGSLSAPAIAPEGTDGGVVVTVEGTGPSNSAVIGLDLATGEQRWRRAVGQPIVAAPTVAAGVAYVGSQDRFVYAIDALTGTLRWKKPALAPVFTSAAVGGGRVFVVSEDPTTGQIHLVALAADSGKQLWSFPASGIPQLGSAAPTLSSDTVYAGMANSVFAVNAAKGTERWSTPVRFTFSPASALALSGRSLFAADGDGALYRLDVRTGDRMWDFQFDETQSASAPVVDGGFVLLGLSDGDLAAVEFATGDLRWRGALGAGPAGPPATASVKPGGSVVLVPLEGTTGGLVALERDPSGRLVRIESPTVLHLGRALANFAVAFVLGLVVLLGAFRFVPGLRPPWPEESS
jgi:outer membrane protein assembly factor BamB